MFDKEQLAKAAEVAKQRLKEQAEPKEDLYASFREDEFEPEQEDIMSLAGKTLEDEAYPVLSPSGDVEELPKLDPYDLPIFEGGPTSSEVELMKREWVGHDVFAVEIVGEPFVVRTLNRFEYKQLVSIENLNALQREEVICTTCVMHPVQYDFKVISAAKGGIPSTLAQIIMEASGFTQDYHIQLL